MVSYDDITIEGLLQEAFETRDGLKYIMEYLMQLVMEAGVSKHLGAERSERTVERGGHRAGHKPRGLKTRVGKLELQVPRVRGCEPYRPEMVRRYQRNELALLSVCAEMYQQGVSTRKVQDVLEELGGFSLSAATVSRAARELDEQLEPMRTRDLSEHRYEYLIIDATYMKVRVQGRVVSQAVLVTAGVNEEGRREILDWRVEDSERQDTWEGVFKSLKARGLQGVKAVVSDAHEGLLAALRRHMQGVAWQRCKVHFIRDALKKVSCKKRKELGADLRYIFAADSAAETRERREEVAKKWDKSAPKVSEQLWEELEDCLTAYTLPLEHQVRMRTTNMLERVHEELKRRTRVVRIFPNKASCHRLVGALLVEMHEKWEVEPVPYLNMEVKKSDQAKAQEDARKAA